jgi:hypothetical protein
MAARPLFDLNSFSENDMTRPQPSIMFTDLNDNLPEALKTL